MHFLWTTLAIVALGWCAAGQDPLTVTITPPSSDPVNVEIGDKIDTWTCEINRGATFGLEGTLEWIHKNSDGTELLISQNKNMKDTSGHYDIEFEYDISTYMKSRLIIKSVRVEDLGEWICRATLQSDVKEASKTVNIIHDMDKLEMQVGNVGPYSMELMEDIQLEEGSRGVKCDVEGGNPEASITLTLDGKNVQLDELNSIKKSGTELPSFHTIAQATVDLIGDHTDKVLRCTAQVGEFPARSVAFKLDIMTFPPSIHCQNKTTSKGDKYVEAKCVVVFTKPIKNVSLEVGETNQVILANTDYKQGDTKFITSSLNSTAIQVTIDVYEMLDHHFQHVYYVNVFGHDDKVYREPIIFINAGLNDSNGASSLSQSVLSLSGGLVMLGLLQRLRW